MSEMVQVALAEDATEAEQIQAQLEEAGIDSAVTPAEDSGALKILVREDAVETAHDVIELAPVDDEPTPEL